MASVTDLGLLFWQQARYDEAEAILTEGLETARRTLGPDHPVTLHLANNLGVTYIALERWQDAHDALWLRRIQYRACA